jgi:hypothetical protein
MNMMWICWICTCLMGFAAFLGYEMGHDVGERYGRAAAHCEGEGGHLMSDQRCAKVQYLSPGAP